MGLDPREDTVLDSLPKRKWRLDVVNLSEIRLNPIVLNSVDLKTGRKFTERLRERRLELRRAIESGGVSIWPLVLFAEGLFLIDGHCRHSTLNEMEIPRAFAYTGHLVKQTSSSNRIPRFG